jgi:hypothetical protein
MEHRKHERFALANEEMSQFLRKVDDLANGTDSNTERDLQSLWQRLSTLAPEVGDASRGEELDQSLQYEIATYVKNLLALQSALKKVPCIMMSRKVQQENAKRHLYDLQGWVNAYNQTT